MTWYEFIIQWINQQVFIEPQLSARHTSSLFKVHSWYKEYLIISQMADINQGFSKYFH